MWPMWRRLRDMDGATQVVFGLLIMSLILWGIFADFGMNLFTEVIGIGVTVFLIDLVYKRRETARLAPARAAAAKDAKRLAQELLSFSSQVLYATLEERELSLLRRPGARLSDRDLEPAYARLAVSGLIYMKTGPGSVAEWMHWAEAIYYYSARIKMFSSEFGQRWSSFADPRLVAACHEADFIPVFQRPDIFAGSRSIAGSLLSRPAAIGEKILDVLATLDPTGDVPYSASAFVVNVISTVEQAPLWSVDKPFRQPGQPA